MKKLLAAMVMFLGLSVVKVESAGAQAVKPTSVLVNLSLKQGVTRDKVAPIMLQEVSDTVQAYLDGKILQWWSKADGSGVMFILNATSVEDAKAIMAPLPLDKAGLVDLQYTPLAPLQPLKRLIEAAKK